MTGPGTGGEARGPGADVEPSADVERSAAAALDELRRRHAALIDAIPDFLWLKGLDGCFLSVNAAFAAYLGRHPADVVGRLDTELLPPALVAYFRQQEEHVVAHDVAVVTEEEVASPDGILRWYETIKAPFRGADGRATATVGAARDVTRRHEAEQRLDRQHRLLEEVQTLANVGSWEWDPRDGRVTMSPVLRRIYGLADDEPFTLETWFERVHPDDRARVRAMVERSTRSPTPIGLDHRIVRPEGTVRLIHMRGRPQLDETGALVGYVGSSQDVTERAQLEARLAQAEKLEAVGQLAGGVAHDFNNMLTAVIGNLDLVAAALPDGSTARLDLAEARRAAERAAELTRQLLAYGRKQVLSPRLLDVNRVLQENATLLRRALPSSTPFDLVYGSPLPHVRADPGQLVRVVMNLVLNARDAVRAVGGGAVRVETAERRIGEAEAARLSALPFGALPPGHYVAITVRDTGAGMDAATTAHVFEPFFTTKPVGEGTGLGLATVFGIVTQSGGAVQVESAPGQGSAFTILLPAVDDDEDVAPPPSAPRGAETVLLVEDDVGVRGVARRVLERNGYTVIEAGHGADALRCVAERDGAVDLVLTDVRMPVMDGRELARHLRAERPDLRVVLMSGYASEGTAPGDLRFLAKPFTASALLVAVREALDAG